MRHYDYLDNEEMESVFYIKPSEIERNCEKETLSHSLGAMLYMPAVRESIAEDLITKKNSGLKSIAICLEDAIGDKKVSDAEANVCKTFNEIKMGITENRIGINELPFIFIRVRSSEQMIRIVEKLKDDIDILTGFIFPKFTHKNGEEYFEELTKINLNTGRVLYGMPIFETSDIMYKESRIDTLININKILKKYENLVLNLRIGATDFSNIYGIRRGYDINIYNISVLRDCIGDIINIFSRVDNQYVISGPVWEYFSGGDRVMKPQLRQTPFYESYGKSGNYIRKKIIDEYIDGLLYEVVLDKANGLWGKTIIHPSHIIPVQALYAVTHEEYMDALSILNNNTGEIGVLKSDYTNKMNEIKTHANWADKILLRSKIYGVLNEGRIFTDLFEK